MLVQIAKGLEVVVVSTKQDYDQAGIGELWDEAPKVEAPANLVAAYQQALAQVLDLGHALEQVQARAGQGQAK